jgi:protein-disulfide isomerase
MPHAHFPALPVEGASDSAIRVVSFESLACGDCERWRTMLEQELLPRYGGEVAFVTRDFPLERHAWAGLAAMASRRFASWDSEACLEFRSYCLRRRAEISPENLPERIGEFAERHGFDVETSVMSLENEDLRQAVEADRAEGMARGVEKTPTVFVGEQAFVETMTVEEVAAAIDALLAGRGGD